MITASDVADYLLALAEERAEEVNNLKLQKLLYYAQAWHLGLHGEPLFADTFQAWSTGPVIPSLYERWKCFGIRHVAGHGERPELDAQLARLLADVADEYLPLDEYELASLAYREAPFQNARRGLDLSEPCEAELSENDMRAFFGHLLAAA